MYKDYNVQEKLLGFVYAVKTYMSLKCFQWLQSIAARANGEPCCDWVGEGGAGHFVKMVHNGIEYGDMQLICEAYHLMKSALGMSNDEMSQVFETWNKGELDSFLIDITKDILKFKDSDGKYLVEKIRDSAGQKGTGKWTAIAALDYGIPVTLIGESVFSRCLSSLIDERAEASKVLPGPSNTKYTGDKKQFLDDIRKKCVVKVSGGYAVDAPIPPQEQDDYDKVLEQSDHTPDTDQCEKKTQWE
ncbi:hypothetical protein J6590_077400 [Homalodisca vitripennis]|nr:hypothetical protein J6590_077400 [Homalodisca vitripennis]